MAVKILIKRTFKKDALKDASAMLIKARSNAMGNTGYISTETLVNFDDPCQVVVVSMWQRKEDWDTYANSAARKDNEKNFTEILAKETEYEIFKMGM